MWLVTGSEKSPAGGLTAPARGLPGGGAGAYLRHGRLEFEHVPDLLHRGLRQLWRERGGKPA